MTFSTGRFSMAFGNIMLLLSTRSEWEAILEWNISVTLILLYPEVIISFRFTCKGTRKYLKLQAPITLHQYIHWLYCIENYVS